MYSNRPPRVLFSALLPLGLGSSQPCALGLELQSAWHMRARNKYQLQEIEGAIRVKAGIVWVLNKYYYCLLSQCWRVELGAQIHKLRWGVHEEGAS